MLKVCNERADLLTPNFQSVNYCVFSIWPGGTDFEQVSRTVTFTAESDTACTAITVVDDRVALEGSEQFTVELTLPPGQPGLQLGTDRQTTITITDNDGIYSATANIR